MSTEQKDKTPRELVSDLTVIQEMRKEVTARPLSEERSSTIWKLENREYDIRDQLQAEKNR